MLLITYNPYRMPRNPRIVDASESQTTKRRKADDYTASSTLQTRSYLHHRMQDINE